MINRVSAGVARWLSQEGAISDRDKPLFAYAVYSLLFGLAPVVIALLLGLLFNMIAEGLLLITPFMLIRKFSGGYHLNSAKVCSALSTGVLATAFLLIKLFLGGEHLHVLTILVVTSVACIVVCSPIDSKARRLSKKEIAVFRLIARMLATVGLLTYTGLLASGIYHVAVPVGIGIMISAILQVPCLVESLLKRYISGTVNCQ